MRATGSSTVTSPAGAIHSIVPRDALRDGRPEGDRPGLRHLSEHAPGLDAVAGGDERREAPAPFVVERDPRARRRAAALPPLRAGAACRRRRRRGGPGRAPPAAAAPSPTTGSPGRIPPVYAYTWTVATAPSSAITSPGSRRSPTSTSSSIAGGEVVDLDDGAVDTADAAGAHRHRRSSSSSSDRDRPVDERRQRVVDRGLPLAADDPSEPGRVQLELGLRAELVARGPGEAVEQLADSGRPLARAGPPLATSAAAPRPAGAAPAGGARGPAASPSLAVAPLPVQLPARPRGVPGP